MVVSAESQPPAPLTPQDVPWAMRMAAKAAIAGLRPSLDLAVSISETGLEIVGRCFLAKTVRHILATQTELSEDYRSGLTSIAERLERGPDPHPDGRPAVAFVLFEWSGGVLLCRMFDEDDEPTPEPIVPNARGGQA